jgi:hypothetical protein
MAGRDDLRGAVIITGRVGPQTASVPQSMIELWRQTVRSHFGQI